MTVHFFLLGEAISQERLGWIEESLKFYFVKLHPENLLHHSRHEEGVFTFLLTGDALYSLIEPETMRIWEIILSLPSVRIICDRQELSLRGISVEGLKMKHPDQVIDHNRLGVGGQQSFWNDVAKIARQHEQPIPSTIGYLQIESPYMYRSSLYALRCLTASIDVHASAELYTYLDGVHLGHTGQHPTESENIGKGLEEIAEKAAKRGLQCQMTACARCATSRGYSTWDDGKGLVVSACTIRPFRIKNMSELADRFEHNHTILGYNVASIELKKEGQPASFSLEESGRAPPLLILITRTPYGTERAFGAISFAVGCAAKGILTRVIFIEDGVYALTGVHTRENESAFFSLPEIIDVVAGSDNLQFFAFQPSLHRRGTSKNPKMNAVLDIGMTELGQLLFYPPKGEQAGHQRVIFF
ncbi:DsrE family protein [Methanoregula sp.]|uniref:DsrE family protein n=1 Tax=Methanoregula sp. TaxID=2052170 RepID=UPI003C75B97B